MSDDETPIAGRLRTKLVDTKQKWAEQGRLLTGRTAAPS